MKNERDQFVISFSERLVFALKQQGHASSHAVSGVKVSQLSQAIGCSNQMARRYVLGRALPDYRNVLAMSHWLEVDPGWLLFGDVSRLSKFDERGLVGIDYDLLEHILIKSFPLFRHGDSEAEVATFLVDMIYDASNLKADRDTIIKMIDMAISSATRFKSSVEEEEPVGS